MAIYKYACYLEESQNEAFDASHPPNTAAPFSGIYRCMGCGLEAAPYRAALIRVLSAICARVGQRSARRMILWVGREIAVRR